LDRITLGRMGEEEAVGYLQDRGWKILGRNIRHGRKEIDVVASRGRVLAFVEVKCRSNESHGYPAEAITPSKQRGIAEVARAWLRVRRPPAGTWIRFDAVSVLYTPEGPPIIRHLPDAWRLE
jgi:putative endonuclease